MKFEYRVQNVDEDGNWSEYMGHDPGNYPRFKWHNMNELGAEGWELVSVVQTPAEEFKAFFKRVVEEPQPMKEEPVKEMGLTRIENAVLNELREHISVNGQGFYFAYDLYPQRNAVHRGKRQTLERLAKKGVIQRKADGTHSYTVHVENAPVLPRNTAYSPNDGSTPF